MDNWFAFACQHYLTKAFFFPTLFIVVHFFARHTTSPGALSNFFLEVAMAFSFWPLRYMEASLTGALGTIFLKAFSWINDSSLLVA